MTRTLLLASAVLVAAAVARAQSLNVDVGHNPIGFGVPPPTFGAAASQPGTWNAVNPNASSPVALVGLGGAATGVTLQRTIGSPASFAFDNVFLSGDAALLLEDAQDIGFTPANSTWVVAGLGAGTYRAYVYAWAPDDPAYVTTVNGMPVGGAWPGGFQNGVTHAEQTIVVPAGGSITFVLQTVIGYGSLNGIQLVLEAPTPVPYCFGDGSGTACPCGNAGAAGNGCAHSLNPSGARLAATGIASVSADTFVLAGSGMPDATALYFQGSARVAGGSGAPFGDGLRCAAGTVIRLGTKTNSAGSSTYPQAGDQLVSVRGLIAPGVVRDYQCWFRNAAAFCTSDTYNLTNGLEVLWAP